MPKKAAAKKTTFGADLIEGMKQVLAHQRGKIELEQVWPKPIDVKAIRKRVKMSQAEFSRAYGISKRAFPTVCHFNETATLIPPHFPFFPGRQCSNF